MRRYSAIFIYLGWILLSIGLAWVFPQVGAKGGPLATEWTTKLAVFVIFLNQGLVLPTEDLKQGLMKWKFHLSALTFIFGVFPLLTLIWILGLQRLLHDTGSGLASGDILLGYLYLGLLPTTITTAVVYTSKAGGDSPAALFTTAVSNVMGVFTVPLMVGGILVVSGFEAELEGFHLGPTLLKISSLILVPLLVGQLLRPWGKTWAGRHKGFLKNLNVGLIYFIVFAAFSESFVSGTWEGYDSLFVGVHFVSLALLLALVNVLAWMTGRLLFKEQGDRIAYTFCASQKTLAAGVPMAGAIFSAASPDLGMVLLPIMIYHPLQLILGGSLIGFWSERTKSKGRYQKVDKMPQ